MKYKISEKSHITKDFQPCSRPFGAWSFLSFLKQIIVPPGQLVLEINRTLQTDCVPVVWRDRVPDLLARLGGLVMFEK